MILIIYSISDNIDLDSELSGINNNVDFVIESNSESSNVPNHNSNPEVIGISTTVSIINENVSGSEHKIDQTTVGNDLETNSTDTLSSLTTVESGSNNINDEILISTLPSPTISRSTSTTFENTEIMNNGKNDWNINDVTTNANDATTIKSDTNAGSTEQQTVKVELSYDILTTVADLENEINTAKDNMVFSSSSPHTTHQIEISSTLDKELVNINLDVTTAISDIISSESNGIQTEMSYNPSTERNENQQYIVSSEIVTPSTEITDYTRLINEHIQTDDDISEQSKSTNSVTSVNTELHTTADNIPTINDVSVPVNDITTTTQENFISHSTGAPTVEVELTSDIIYTTPELSAYYSQETLESSARTTDHNQINITSEKLDIETTTIISAEVSHSSNVRSTVEEEITSHISTHIMEQTTLNPELLSSSVYKSEDSTKTNELDTYTTSILTSAPSLVSSTEGSTLIVELKTDFITPTAEQKEFLNPELSTSQPKGERVRSSTMLYDSNPTNTYTSEKIYIDIATSAIQDDTSDQPTEEPIVKVDLTTDVYTNTPEPNDKPNIITRGQDELLYSQETTSLSSFTTDMLKNDATTAIIQNNNFDHTTVGYTLDLEFTTDIISSTLQNRSSLILNTRDPDEQLIPTLQKITVSPVENIDIETTTSINEDSPSNHFTEEKTTFYTTVEMSSNYFTSTISGTTPEETEVKQSEFTNNPSISHTNEDEQSKTDSRMSTPIRETLTTSSRDASSTTLINEDFTNDVTKLETNNVDTSTPEIETKSTYYTSSEKTTDKYATTENRIDSNFSPNRGIENIYSDKTDNSLSTTGYQTDFNKNPIPHGSSIFLTRPALVIMNQVSDSVSSLTTTVDELQAEDTTPISKISTSGITIVESSQSDKSTINDIIMDNTPIHITEPTIYVANSEETSSPKISTPSELPETEQSRNSEITTAIPQIVSSDISNEKIPNSGESPTNDERKENIPIHIIESTTTSTNAETGTSHAEEPIHISVIPSETSFSVSHESSTESSPTITLTTISTVTHTTSLNSEDTEEIQNTEPPFVKSTVNTQQQKPVNSSNEVNSNEKFNSTNDLTNINSSTPITNNSTPMDTTKPSSSSPILSTIETTPILSTTTAYNRESTAPPRIVESPKPQKGTAAAIYPSIIMFTLTVLSTRILC